MLFSLIVAYTENLIIGSGNQIPWKLPSDLKNFKKMTTGKNVVMGKKTFDSIGKPLTNRYNIVLSSDCTNLNERNNFSNLIFTDSIEKATFLAGNSEYKEETVFIGGSRVYELALNFVSRMYITTIHGSCKGDITFPDFDKSKWKIMESTFCEDDQSYFNESRNNSLKYTFEILERIKEQ